MWGGELRSSPAAVCSGKQRQAIRRRSVNEQRQSTAPVGAHAPTDDLAAQSSLRTGHSEGARKGPASSSADPP